MITSRRNLQLTVVSVRVSLFSLSLCIVPFFSVSVPCHSCLCRSMYVRNQEKGVLAKGVSTGSSVTPKETKNTQGYWAPADIWHSERYSQERRTSCKNPLLKTPFSLFLSMFWSTVSSELHQFPKIGRLQDTDLENLSPRFPRLQLRGDLGWDAAFLGYRSNSQTIPWWTFRIFFIFFFSGARERGRRRPSKWPGGAVFIKSREGGGVPRRRRGRGKGFRGMSVGEEEGG